MELWTREDAFGKPWERAGLLIYVELMEKVPRDAIGVTMHFQAGPLHADLFYLDAKGLLAIAQALRGEEHGEREFSLAPDEEGHEYEDRGRVELEVEDQLATIHMGQTGAEIIFQLTTEDLLSLVLSIEMWAKLFQRR